MPPPRTWEFSLEETDEGSGSESTDVEPAEGESGDVIGDLATSGDTTTQTTETRDAPASTAEAREEIYAVQQVYALRINRVEVTPSVSQSLNDPFVSHTGIGLGLNYWWTNVLALGLNFIWYEGLESESELGLARVPGPPLDAPLGADQPVPVRCAPELHVRPRVRQVLDVQRVHLPVRRLHTSAASA